MSIISEKIQAELNNIDIKAIIIERITLKVDKILENRTISTEIDRVVKHKIVDEINKSISE